MDISDAAGAVRLAASGDRSCYVLDLDAKTLRRLPRSDEHGITVSHSGDLMTSLDLFDLVISSVADGREIDRIVNGPCLSRTGNPYVSWAPDDKHIFFRSAGSTTGFIASVEATPKMVAADTPGDRAVTGRRTVARWSSPTSTASSQSMPTGPHGALYSWPAGSSVVPDDLRLSPDGKFALVMEYRSRDRPRRAARWERGRNPDYERRVGGHRRGRQRKTCWR